MKIALLLAATCMIAAVAALAKISAPHERATGPAILLIEKGDCSLSMRGAQPGLPSVAKEIALDGARPGSMLLAGTFAGETSESPNPWPVEERYRLDKEGAGGNANLAAERLIEQGEENGERVERLMECPPGTQHRKTPLLSVLEECARALESAAVGSGIERRVVLLTDGELIGDGLDARAGITGQEADAAVRRFTPSLTGLRGAKVWIIGAGSGTSVDRLTLSRIRSILDRALTNVGADLVSFGPSTTAYPLPH